MTLILSPTSFSDLKNNLEYCDQLFLQHQVQLMNRNMEQALDVFEQIVNIRKTHLKIMEELLLPAFVETAKKIPEGAKALYFEREKKLILKYLDIYVRRLSDIVLHSQSLDIVTLFEDYAWFKDLLDHHDAREKAFLLPALDTIQFPGKKDLLNETIKCLNSLENNTL